MSHPRTTGAMERHVDKSEGLLADKTQAVSGSSLGNPSLPCPHTFWNTAALAPGFLPLKPTVAEVMLAEMEFNFIVLRKKTGRPKHLGANQPGRNHRGRTAHGKHRRSEKPWA